MNIHRKLKWYKFEISKRIENLENVQLIKELEQIINDIREKKLDRAGMFRQLIRQLEDLIEETKFKPKQKGRTYDAFYIPRSGDARVVLFGISNVGKSTLMNEITNTYVKTSEYLHTTKIAQAGTCEFNNLRIQIVDVPGFLDFKEDWEISKQIIRVARTCDAILLVIDISYNVESQYNFLIQQLDRANLMKNHRSSYKLGIIATKGDLPGSKENYIFLQSITSLKIQPISIKNKDSLENLKHFIFNNLDLIRIYTKPPNQKVNLKKPFICPKGTLIGELAEKIHTDFVKLFNYARVWGPSADFPGKRVGIEHELMDTDIVELKINR